MAENKPLQKYFKMGKSILGVDSSELIIIGDDWRTDMIGALAIGANGFLIRSGKYRNGDEFNVPGVKCIDKFGQIELG